MKSSKEMFSTQLKILPVDTGCLGLVHGDDPERCYGEGDGRGGACLGMHVHPWWIHVNV